MEGTQCETQKMKFLDNLFDTPSEKVTNCNSNENENITIERSYLKLEDEYKEKPLKSVKEEKTDKNTKLFRKVGNIFTFKLWIGTVLSFFFLSYVFSLRMIIVIPLLFFGLIIYTIISLGHKYYSHYVKQIRHFVKIRFLGKEKCEDGYEYRLMEI